jgi:hypothetical protein
VTPGQAHRLDLHSPILKPEQLEAIKAMSFRNWETRVGGLRAAFTAACMAGAGFGTAGRKGAWRETLLAERTRLF